MNQENQNRIHEEIYSVIQNDRPDNGDIFVLKADQHMQRQGDDREDGDRQRIQQRIYHGHQQRARPINGRRKAALCRDKVLILPGKRRVRRKGYVSNGYVYKQDRAEG